jgi:hypothetical protein
MGEGAGQVAPRDDRALRGISIQKRLAEIEQRLVELRRARPARPDQRTAMELLLDAQRHAADADRHWRESVARTRLVRQLVVQAFHNAARAHDHAAEASERSARAGFGDITESRRRAAFHRAAADADRSRAEEIESQAVEPDPSG